MSRRDPSILTDEDRVSVQALAEMKMRVTLPDFHATPEELALAATPSAKKALTYGWDTAFAIKQSDVNAAISKAKSSPKTFAETAPDKSGTISGSFGDWALAGGDGTLLHMSLPITAGSVAIGQDSVDISGTSAIIEVQLNYLPPPPAQAPNLPPSNHDLKMKLSASGPVKVVSVLKVNTPASFTFIQKAMLQGLLELWLNTNLSSFVHTFSAIELNRKVDHANFKWLAPTATGYAYVKNSTAADSILAVLCMTENRSPDKLSSQISPNAIPDGARAGFLISQERFLEKMVLPSLPSVFPGAKPTDFKMGPDKKTVVNTTRIKTKPVKHAGSTYQPEIVSLSVSITGDEVVVYSKTETDVGMGSTSVVEATSYQNIILVDKPDGTQTLSYKTARPTIKSNHTITSATGQILKTLLALVAVIVGAILAIFTDGASLVVALIIVGLLVGLAGAAPQLISDALGKKISNNSPSLALLTSNSTDPITWPDSKAFKLSSAGLAGSLQLGGNPGFV